MKNKIYILLLTIAFFVISCTTKKKTDFDFIGLSYNSVIQNPTSGIKIIGAPPIYCEIYKTYLITKDTIYSYSYNNIAQTKKYRFMINDKFKSLLNKSFVNSVDTLKELNDSNYTPSPITIFEQKSDSLKIKNFQMFCLDNKSYKLIDSLYHFFNSARTQELNDTIKIYTLNKQIEKFNVINRQPDLHILIH